MLQAGDADRAAWWFNEMRAAGFEPDLQAANVAHAERSMYCLSLEAYNTLLDAHAACGNMDAADEARKGFLAAERIFVRVKIKPRELARFHFGCRFLAPFVCTTPIYVLESFVHMPGSAEHAQRRQV